MVEKTEISGEFSLLLVLYVCACTCSACIEVDFLTSSLGLGLQYRLVFVSWFYGELSFGWNFQFDDFV